MKKAKGGRQRKHERGVRQRMDRGMGRGRKGQGEDLEGDRETNKGEGEGKKRGERDET